jgi:3-deoxy-manno-octulosonate cytidylyltransferase (CMP-KDO synthetase)
MLDSETTRVGYNHSMNILGVIPARLNSTRLPGKVLKPIGGRPLVAWVYDAARKSRRLTDVVVATDAEEVFDACESLAIPVIMSSPEHRCGSDRLYEVMGKMPADIYVNIQGDEPTLRPAHLDLLLTPFFERPAEVFVTTLKVRLDDAAAQDPNNVKVITDLADRALYFSRYPVPYDRDGRSPVRFKHIGLYAYRRETLEQFHSWPPSELELSENLEQLRFLEHGVPIHVLETEFNTIGVDTEADLERARAILEE